MTQQIPWSVKEYIDTQLLWSAKDFQMTNDLKAVWALQYNNTIIYGIMVPDTRKNIPQEVKEWWRTRLSKDLSEFLNWENLWNWIMLAEPSIPDYQRFLKYIAIQAYEENNSIKNIREIEEDIINKFKTDTNPDDDHLIDFLIARQAFLKWKLIESWKSPDYYNDVANTIDWLESII